MWRSHLGRSSSMFQEIVAFILSTSGWVLVSSTLPMDYWKVSSLDGTVITTATYWSNLWKTCVTDSTGVSNCKDFPSMLALDGQLFLLSLLDVFFYAFDRASFNGFGHHVKFVLSFLLVSVLSTSRKVFMFKSTLIHPQFPNSTSALSLSRIIKNSSWSSLLFRTKRYPKAEP